MVGSLGEEACRSLLDECVTGLLPIGTTSARRCSWIYEQQFPTATGAGSTPRRQARFSASTVYFFGGETWMSFVTLTTPSVSFASRSASALACSFGTVPFR